mmetsp:Transcript_13858/g.28600  ORF Transcript_13858/g.28600 Transcript_13858/m.28600 type:complete len:208 (+) Transcript_13858:166-789(+)
MMVMIELQSQIISQCWLHDDLGKMVDHRDNRHDGQQRSSDGNVRADPRRYTLGVRMVFHRVLSGMHDLMNDPSRNHEARWNVKGCPITCCLPLFVVRGVPCFGGNVGTNCNSRQAPSSVIQPTGHECISGHCTFAGKSELAIAPYGSNRLCRNHLQHREFDPCRDRNSPKETSEFTNNVGFLWFGVIGCFAFFGFRFVLVSHGMCVC